MREEWSIACGKLYHASVIDSHCHLADTKFDADIEAVITRANDAGVSQMICIADSMVEGEKCRAIAERFACVSWTMGVHPHVASGFDMARDPDVLRAALKHPKCKAVGEIGLDYHYMNSPKDVQQRVFEEQLKIAKECNVPAVVHCRDAVEDVWAIINHVKPKKLVVHCCTERWQDVERFVATGYFLSFTGIATYPKSDVIRDCIARCPLAQMMIETDSPYLAPVPHRGKRNEPSFVAEVAAVIAKTKNMDLADVITAMDANTVTFFDL